MCTCFCVWAKSFLSWPRGLRACGIDAMRWRAPACRVNQPFKRATCVWDTRISERARRAGRSRGYSGYPGTHTHASQPILCLKGHTCFLVCQGESVSWPSGLRHLQYGGAHLHAAPCTQAREHAWANGGHLLFFIDIGIIAHKKLCVCVIFGSLRLSPRPRRPRREGHAQRHAGAERAHREHGRCAAAAAQPQPQAWPLAAHG